MRSGPGVAGAAILVVGCGLVGMALAAGAASPTRATMRRPHAHVCRLPGVGKRLDHVWRPDMAAAVGYARGRAGDIAFAVRTNHRFHGYRANRVEWSASVVKAMLMVAYFDRPSVAGRALNGYDRSLLVPMITRSDNNAATAVRDIVGNGGLQALAARVGMKNFGTDPIWGRTRITAADQTRFFFSIDRYIAARHRAYGMHLLASITPSQRWGIGEVAPKGWRLYFKGDRATAPGCSTTRSRCWYGGALASRWRC